jgi:nitrous oxidase accessory protein
MDVKPAQFFRASPALEAIDFVERLAPVSQPRLLLRDSEPVVRRTGPKGPTPVRKE